MDELPATIQTIDDIPEDATISVRSLYREGDNGGLVLRVKPVNGFALENVASLTEALDDVTAKAKTRKERLEKYVIDGEELTPERAAELHRKVKELGNLPSADKIRDELKKDFESRHEEGVAKLRSEYDNKVQEYEQDIEDLVIRRAIQQHVGEKGNPEWLYQCAKEDGVTAVREGRGRYTIRILKRNADGTTIPQRSRRDAMKDMDLEEYLESTKDSDDPRFRGAWFGSGKSGGGTTPVAAATAAEDTTTLRVPFSKAGSAEVQKAIAEGKRVEFTDEE